MQNVEVRDDQQVPVCNLTIRDHHSFAVGDEAVLVHNAGWCTYLEKLRPKPAALLKQIDDGLIDSVVMSVTADHGRLQLHD